MFAIQRTVSEGLIPVTTEYDQITNFRTAMYHEGNPCGFDGVQPNFVMFAESLGNGVNHGEPEPEPDPIHEELQHSLRRHLASTPAGRTMARRKARELFETQVAQLGEEEHKRRLQVEIFTRNEGRIVADESC